MQVQECESTSRMHWMRLRNTVSIRLRSIVYSLLSLVHVLVGLEYLDGIVLEIVYRNAGIEVFAALSQYYNRQ